MEESLEYSLLLKTVLTLLTMSLNLNQNLLNGYLSLHQRHINLVKALRKDSLNIYVQICV